MNNFNIIQVKPNEIWQYKNNIIALWKENLANGSEKRFEWLYKLNPEGTAITWLARKNDTGEIVGCNSVYPIKLFIKDKEYKLGINIDFAVNKEYRVFGPALQIERRIVSQIEDAGFDFLLTWPSPSSLGVFVRAGYEILGDIESWIKRIETSKSLIKFLKSRFLASLFGACLDFCFYINDIKARLFMPRDLVSGTATKCDASLMNVALQSLQKSPVNFKKTASFLNWRYADCPYEDCLFFFIKNKNVPSAEAFLVFSMRDDICLVWDFFAADKNHARYLISSFIHYLRKRKVAAVSFSLLNNQELRRVFNEFHFFQKKANRPCVLFVKQNFTAEFRDLLRDKNNWLLLDGDLDL